MFGKRNEQRGTWFRRGKERRDINCEVKLWDSGQYVGCRAFRSPSQDSMDGFRQVCCGDAGDCCFIPFFGGLCGRPSLTVPTLAARKADYYLLLVWVQLFDPASNHLLRLLRPGYSSSSPCTAWICSSSSAT